MITCHSADAGAPADLNGQTDGPAPLFRMYPSGTRVQLQAPATFGSEKFKEWQALNGNTVSAEAALQLQLDSAQVDATGGKLVRCVYVASAAESLAASAGD